MERDRTRAYARILPIRRREDDGALLYHPSKVSWATAKLIGAPPAIAARLFFYAILFSLAVAITYAYFARVAVTVEAPGVIMPEQGVLPISAPVTFTVKHLLVADGQTVAEDQLLISSADNLSDAEASAVLQHRARALELLEADRTNACKRCPADLEALAAKAFSVETGGQISEKLALIRQNLREYAAARALSENRGSTAALRRAIAVARGKLAEIEKRKATELLAAKVEELESEIISAQSQLADREKGDQGTLEQARIRLGTQLGELEKDVERYREEQAITAPIAGTVIDLNVSGPGQRLAAGQVVMQLVPEDAVLGAELRVANKDISKVRVGQEARLELAALPVRDYGAVGGTVQTIAPNATYDRVARGDVKGPPELTYRVLVKLDRQAVTKDEKTHSFRMGMTLRGLIVSSHESMLTLGVRRLLGLKDELLPEYEP